MRRFAFAALCLALAAGFAALGVWQIERRAWKLDLIATVESRVHAAPTGLPADLSGDVAYRRVRVSGRLLNDRETYVQAVTERGPGWWVITPLLLLRHPGLEPGPNAPHTPSPDKEDLRSLPVGPRLKAGVTVGGRGEVILINRGFVPQEKRDPATRTAPTETTITGLIRTTEPGGAFLRSNDPAQDRWFSRDVTAIAAKRQLANPAPIFIDADATPNPGGYPVGGLTVIAFRNNHLMYAITWFGLCALSLAGTWLILRTRRT